MRERDSTSVKNDQSQSVDLLIALVRLLARQAAADFVSVAPVPDEPSKHKPENRE
jgi:hypothetical protein